MNKKFKIKNLKNYLVYFLIFSVFIFSIINILTMRSFQNDLENNNLNLSECAYFIFSKSSEVEFNSSKFEIEREDLYVFPEIQNLTCLGKLGKISATENIYTGVVYTNTKFINLVLFSINFLLYLFRFNLKIFEDLDYFLLFTVLNIGVLYNFYNSTNVVSLNFIFVSLIVYLLTKTENIEDI